MQDERKIVEEHCSKLLEHFDSVRIFVTKHDGGKDASMAVTVGGGNFYAQLGQINEWKGEQDQIAREAGKQH